MNHRDPSRPEHRIQTLAALVLYGVCIACLMWPLWPKFGNRLPIGTEDVRTVPLFNAWTIGWNAACLGNRLESYWDAPIFFPDRNTFAYSEPQPMTMLVAPLVWRGSTTIAYNVYLVASLWLNGCVAFFFLRWLRYNWLPAFFGGLATTALPIVHWQLGVVQLVPMWGVLWSLWALARFQAQSVERSASLMVAGIELGAALAITSWMAIYHAIFLATLLAVSLLVLGRRLFQLNVMTGLLFAALIGLILTSPMLEPMWRLSKNTEFVRPTELVEKLSLLPRDYLSVYGHTPLLQFYLQPERYWRMNPGWIKVALALVGLCAGWHAAHLRRWTGLLLVICVTAFALSMGTHLKLGSWNLWEWLTSTLPGFKQVRSPFRYAYFVQLGIVLGAAGGLQAIWSLAARVSNWFARSCLQLVAVLLAAIAIVDPLPETLRLCVVPEVSAGDEWCAELRRSHISYPGAALCLPMSGGDEARDFEKTCEWMLYGIRHRVPLVNGYSGFCPQRIADLGAALATKPFTAEQLSALHKQGVRYLVVERNLFHLPWKPDQPVAGLKLDLLIASPSGIDVYSLKQL